MYTPPILNLVLNNSNNVPIKTMKGDILQSIPNLDTMISQGEVQKTITVRKILLLFISKAFRTLKSNITEVSETNANGKR